MGIDGIGQCERWGIKTNGWDFKQIRSSRWSSEGQSSKQSNWCSTGTTLCAHRSGSSQIADTIKGKN